MIRLEALANASEARADIEAWGYVRPLVDGELEASPALRAVDADGVTRGWMWFLPFDDLEAGPDDFALCPHLVSDKKWRGRVWTLYAIIAAHKFAGDMGATRMIAEPGEAENMRGMLRRMGWTERDGGVMECRLPWEQAWRFDRG